MAWKKGPMPSDTYGWGGVVPFDETTGGGFYFADFQGDKVVTYPGERVLKPHEVVWYDSDLTLPPNSAKSARRLG